VVHTSDRVGDTVADFVVAVAAGDAQTIGAIRRSLAKWLADAPISEDRACDVLLACYEAMANVVEHAYAGDEPASFELRASRHRANCVLVVTITDHGSWRIPPTDSAGRGRGLLLLSALCDKADIHAEREGTTIELAWDLPNPVR